MEWASFAYSIYSLSLFLCVFFSCPFLNFDGDTCAVILDSVNSESVWRWSLRLFEFNMKFARWYLYAFNCIVALQSSVAWMSVVESLSVYMEPQYRFRVKVRWCDILTAFSLCRTPYSLVFCECDERLSPFTLFIWVSQCHGVCRGVEVLQSPFFYPHFFFL